MLRFYPLYTLLLQLFVIIAAPVRAQILYTDIIPDEVVKAPENLPFAEFGIDLDHDGERDIKLKHYSTSPQSASVQIYSWPGGKDEAVLCHPAERVPAALPKGFQITPALSSLQFINTYHDGVNDVLFINTAADTTEEWDTGEDRYVGVILAIKGNWHVGWIRLNMPADASELIVKDYAIQLTPNRWIEAGNMGTTGIDIPNEPDLRADIYSTGSTLVVELPASPQNTTLDVYSILGAHVGEYRLTAAVNRISMRTVPPGAYMAVVRQESVVTTKLVAVW